MTPKEVVKDIHRLTIAAVELSLSDDQNFPSENGEDKGDCEIAFSSSGSMAIALRDLSYREIYAELVRTRCYNLKLLDGALLLLRYRFRRRVVVEHVLSYFPSPSLEPFQNDPEVYLQDELFADIVSRNVVPFPLRFDFNGDVKRRVDIDHPASHLTLGQYKNCRIPVSSPVPPLIFGGFILRNFYNTAFRQITDKLPSSKGLFTRTISKSESAIPHVEIGT